MECSNLFIYRSALKGNNDYNFYMKLEDQNTYIINVCKSFVYCIVQEETMSHASLRLNVVGRNMKI